MRFDDTCPNDWAFRSIEDRCSRITSGGTPSRAVPSFYVGGEGIPWVKTKELNNWLIEDTEEHISEDAIRSSSAKILPERSILIAMYGATVGELGILAAPMACNQACCALIVNQDSDDERFLFYQLLSKKQDIKGQAVGAAQQNISAQFIRSIELPTPPKAEQKAIAHILGTLDNKIELNRKTNETLKEMAKALFKSWFVDFDPVRAKAEGRPTGLPAEISDLFPHSFEDSELGEIPSGWRVNTFEQICESIYSGGTPLTTEPNYWNGGLPWFSSGETRNAFVNTTDKTISLLGVEESSTRFARKFSTVIASAGQGHTRGQTSMLLLDSYVNQSVVVLEASKELASEHFVFFDASRRYDEFRRVSDSSSSRGSLTTKILASLTTVNPPRQIHGIFKSIVGASIEKIHSNLDQILVLTDARDCLLPKLISGEIRIPDAEKMLEEVGI